ncbi:hypothetical protein RRG08_014183 [Elysia crispata]|uniref:Uncharacterized protein n=1 Tax=Elysia crispata TaxID=231223 RepID=A0AAE1D926_9GAST|nr:hypothetical protein RRG08_014183 [Elysia crispata]
MMRCIGDHHNRLENSGGWRLRSSSLQVSLAMTVPAIVCILPPLSIVLIVAHQVGAFGFFQVLFSLPIVAVSRRAATSHRAPADPTCVPHVLLCCGVFFRSPSVNLVSLPQALKRADSVCRVRFVDISSERF